MDILSGITEAEVPSSTTLDVESHDADTIKFNTQGRQRAPLRISGVDGTEIGSGKDAEFFQKGLMGIMSGQEATVQSEGKDLFGKRDLGNATVGGVNWRHLLYEAGVSENWGKYGYDKDESLDDKRYKWYAGKTQSSNIEAYELLESGVEPSSIIDDEKFARINLLRQSLQTHMGDANEGVLDKEDAQAVVKELMADQDLLAAAQKRRWYETARTSNGGETMLAAWSDELTQSTIRRQNRTQTLDVAPSVDTSYWGMTKNALNQQFSDKVGSGKTDILTHIRGGGFGQNNTEADLDEYIKQNDVAPDVAVRMYNEFEQNGYTAATEVANLQAISDETTTQRAAVDKKTGADYLARMLFNEASPYMVDPTSWVVGAGVGKVAAQATFAKVSSPLLRAAMQGGTVGTAAGLAESMVFTANNYKDFSNKELLTTWATDAGFGGAFGAVFAAAMKGVKNYGERALSKAAGEGIDDAAIGAVATPKSTQRFEENAEFTIREQEDAAFAERGALDSADAHSEFVKEVDATRARMDEMQTEIATELQTGKTEPLVQTIDIEPPVIPPKPAPRVEPAPVVEGKPKTTTEAAETPVDTRTPAQIELEETVWQDAAVAAAITHQSSVVRPALAQVNASHNWIAKVHRALGKSIGMQEFASKMIFSTDDKMSYIGTNILETGAGFSGKFDRPASAALVKDSIYTRNVGNLNKAYVDNIQGWAMQQGSGTYKSWKAAWEGGKVNDVAKEFHKEVFKHQEMLQMGKKPAANEFIEKYVKQLNKTNDELFNGRIDANVKGFDAERRIPNYIPHVWKKVKVAEVIRRHGENVVLELITKSIESAKRHGKIADATSTRELAERQLNWINGLGDSMEHVGGDLISGRAKSRIPLDFSVDHNGLHMVDLIDTDLPSVMDSYIQRAGADIGVSKATGGLIRSEGDFVKYLTPDSAEGKLLAQDAKDMLYGRPTRQGMSPEIRSIMDVVTIQQMGGIGVAQLAETGTMAQRLIVNYVSQPEIAKKLWKAAGVSTNDKGILHQIRSIAAINDNMEYINRYSVNNIDQAQIDELSAYRAASIDAVDKVTLGAYKAQFGRLLGSLSGVNAVQKAQSRLLQASFSVDIARAAKFGKGTSTEARLIDLGLKADSKAFEQIRKHVEFDADGFPENFNFSRWDKDGLDQFVYAMNREEAQLMPRVMAGELPVFMNKPIWQAIMQFRKTPLAFMSKGAQRNMQFADREAVVGTVLNSLTAGVTRYAKVALGGAAYVALSDAEFQAPTLDQAQPYNYVSNFGILGDAYTLGGSWSKAYQQKDGIESLWEGAKVVPVLSAADNAYHALDGDPSAIKKAMPLNTLPLINEVTNAVIRNMGKN